MFLFTYHIVNSKLIRVLAFLLLSFLGTESDTRLFQNLKPLEQLAPVHCPFSFRVYVYKLPPHIAPVKLSEEARANKSFHVCQRCIFEQFSLELIVHDYFSQFCGRTLNPDEADYFYLPIARDVEYREQMSKGKKRASEMDHVLIAAIEKQDLKPWRNYLNITAKYWERNNGADHIIVMPAPVTNLRHESSQRGFFHYMIQLNAPIFVNVEFSRAFVGEYPVCATEKNIVMPYPSTDPDMISGRLMNEPVTITRNKLVFYQGGNRGSCVDIRRGLDILMKDKTIAPTAGARKREMGFRQAVYCPIPVGDSPSSKRQYDVMNFGCIPVVLSDEMLYAFTHVTGGGVNEGNFSIRLPQKFVQKPAHVLLSEIKPHDMGQLPSGTSLYSLLESVVEDAKAKNATIKPPWALVELLLRISPEDVVDLQKGVSKVARKFRYYALNATVLEIPTSKRAFPDGGAMRILSRLLDLRKEKGVIDIHKRCKSERERKNPPPKYIGNYPCEGTKKWDRRNLLHHNDFHNHHNRNSSSDTVDRIGIDDQGLFLTSKAWQF